MTRRTAEDGFSLIELLVVVAITSVLAIGAALALPRGQDPLFKAAIGVERAARDLRAQAMLSGRPERLDTRALAAASVTPGEATWQFAPDGAVSGPPFDLSDAQGRMICRIVEGSAARCTRG